MKSKINKEMDKELCPEYDLSKLKRGIKGKYVRRYNEGTNLVLLDPDVSEAFPNDESVSEALRLLMKIAETKLKPRVHA